MRGTLYVALILSLALLLVIPFQDKKAEEGGPNITYKSPERPRYGMDHIFMEPTYNTTAPHELVRNTSAVVDWYGPRFQVLTNAKGLRDDPFWQTPRNEVTRVLVVGDETVFGYGVNQSDRFTERLENKLDSRLKGNYQVINAGIPSYGMQDYHHFIREKGFQYNPDIIIVSFEIEDAISQKQKESAHLRAQQKLNVSGSDMDAVHSERYDMLVGRFLGEIFQNITVGSSDIVEYGNRTVSDAGRRGVPTIFFLTTPAEEEKILSLISWRDRAGVKLVLPPQEFGENISRYRLITDRTHLNPRGHEVVAQHLYRKILDYGVFTGS